jgi:hypothetical protein
MRILAVFILASAALLAAPAPAHAEETWVEDCLVGEVVDHEVDFGEEILEGLILLVELAAGQARVGADVGQSGAAVALVAAEEIEARLEEAGVSFGAPLRRVLARVPAGNGEPAP